MPCPIDNRRRTLLKLSGLLGLAALSPVTLPAESAEALWFNRRQHKVTRTRLTMGTFVAITAIHSSRDEAEAAIGRTFEEIQRLSSLLSRHDPRSPISELNRSGALHDVPVEVHEVVARAGYFFTQTGGVFDISVKPLMDLYQTAFAAGQKPDEALIDRTLRRVGGADIELHRDEITFNRADMGVTLDGIAKGYIVDRASRMMHENGVTDHLINAGGDIRTSGSAARGKKWKIAIQDPDKNREYPDIVELADGAIATSGNYEIFYDQEKLFHHIIDPRTGHSPNHSSSVTVTAPSVMDADALATALFVLAPDEGRGLIERMIGTECFILERGGTAHRSSGWHH